MFKKLRNYIKNKGLCYGVTSKSNKVVLYICSDLNAARIKTPYTNQLVDIDDILSTLGEAYTAARNESDSIVMEEIHSIRQAITKAHA